MGNPSPMSVRAYARFGILLLRRRVSPYFAAAVFGPMRRSTTCSIGGTVCR